MFSLNHSHTRFYWLKKYFFSRCALSVRYVYSCWKFLLVFRKVKQRERKTNREKNRFLGRDRLFLYFFGSFRRRMQWRYIAKENDLWICSKVFRRKGMPLMFFSMIFVLPSSVKNIWQIYVSLLKFLKKLIR